MECVWIWIFLEYVCASFFFFVIDFWHLVLFVRFCLKKVFQVWATALRPECPFFPPFFLLCNSYPANAFPNMVYLIDSLISSAFIYAKQRKAASFADLILSPTNSCFSVCFWIAVLKQVRWFKGILRCLQSSQFCSVFVLIDQIIVMFNKVTRELAYLNTLFPVARHYDFPSSFLLKSWKRNYCKDF